MKHITTLIALALTLGTLVPLAAQPQMTAKEKRTGRLDRIGQSQGVNVGGKIQNGPLYPLPCGVNIPAVYQFYHVKVIPFTA